MKSLILLGLSFLSVNSFATSFDCEVFKPHWVKSSRTFTLEETRNEGRGKIVGMTTLDGESIRQTPIYGDFIHDKDEAGSFVYFTSDSYNSSLGYAGEPTYEIELEGDIRESLFDGYIIINGEKTMVRCAKLYQLTN